MSLGASSGHKAQLFPASEISSLPQEVENVVMRDSWDGQALRDLKKDMTAELTGSKNGRAAALLGFHRSALSFSPSGPLSCPCPQICLWAYEEKELSSLAVGSQPWLSPEPELGDPFWGHSNWPAKETTELVWGLQDGGRWQTRCLGLAALTVPSSPS